MHQRFACEKGFEGRVVGNLLLFRCFFQGVGVEQLLEFLQLEGLRVVSFAAPHDYFILYIKSLAIIMFKKSASRPTIKINLKKTSEGYRVVPNESPNLFTVRRITRTMYRPDLIQGSNVNVDQGQISSATIIQPPSHVTIPAFSSWFDISEVHQIEREAFPQFFHENEVDKWDQEFTFSKKNPKLYMYYRNVMIGMWRENAKKYLSANLCRKNLMGDVSSIIRIHGFLENWGLINFTSKEHNKGKMIKKASKMECHVCESHDCEEYFLAEIEDTIFCVCENCFAIELYPQEISKQEFVKILRKNHIGPDCKLLGDKQIIRMLEIINGIPNGSPRDRDKDVWSVISKEFPDFSREDVVYNFLRLPKSINMNHNIFDNHEDESMYTLAETEPTIFEDYLNPIQSSIARAYYHYSKNPQTSKLAHLFESSKHHARKLAADQQQKIGELTKMMVQVMLSKLELKALYINEFEKLVNVQVDSKKAIMSSFLAESVKHNFRYVEKVEEPELIEKVEIE